MGLWVAGANANDGVSTLNQLSAQFTIPTAATVNDWALVGLCSNSNTATINTIPSGWSLISGPNRASASNNSMWLFKKQLVSTDLTGSPNTPSFGASTAVRLLGVMDL